MAIIISVAVGWCLNSPPKTQSSEAWSGTICRCTIPSLPAMGSRVCAGIRNWGRRAGKWKLDTLRDGDVLHMAESAWESRACMEMLHVNARRTRRHILGRQCVDTATHFRRQQFNIWSYNILNECINMSEDLYFSCEHHAPGCVQYTASTFIWVLAKRAHKIHHPSHRTGATCSHIFHLNESFRIGSTPCINKRCYWD